MIRLEERKGEGGPTNNAEPSLRKEKKKEMREGKERI